MPEARDKIPGFTTDEHTMTQLVLSYLGAGFRGFGMWAWNYRTAGWEGGEYSMVGRNLVPGPRAKTVGAIAQTMRRLRRELWQSNKEPLVGVLYDWDNEATWAAMAVTGRDRYKNEPVRARIGMGRALLDANIPWEHVTVRNLRAGLAARYPVIICTAQMAISGDLWAMLKTYVRDGGRLVMDMPSAYYDEFLRIIRCGPGTPFERLFGCVLDDLSYSTALQKVVSVDGVAIQGFTAAITPTSGRVAATFDDGAPAIVEHQLGKGSAVLLAFQAGMTMWKPGSTRLQELVVRHALGRYESPYRCAGALCYRLAGPKADHYFLVNPDGDKQVVLDPWAFTYARASDPVTGQAIDLTRPIPIPGHGGRWIRCEK